MKTTLTTIIVIGLSCLRGVECVGDPSPPPLMVTNGNDDGPGSLREAIRDATPGASIQFDFTGVIALTSDELLIDKDLTIAGPGSAVVTISRAENSSNRLVEISVGVNVDISGLTFSGGYVGDVAGGILNNGVLTMTDARVCPHQASEARMARRQHASESSRRHL